MSAISSPGPCSSSSVPPSPQQPGLLDLFRMTLPRSYCENSPPCLSNEGLRDQFLAEHTTYPEALQIDVPITPEKIRIFQNLFIEAQIYLQLNNNTPQAFRPISEIPSWRHCLAFRGTDNKIRCFLWTPLPGKSFHPIFDAATQIEYTLNCSMPNTINEHYWRALIDHEDRCDEYRSLELNITIDSSTEPPEPVIWIPDQIVNNYKDKATHLDSQFNLLCQAWVSGKDLPIQKSEPNILWKSNPFLTELVKTGVSCLKEDDSDDDDVEGIEAMIVSPEFAEHLAEHTTYPQAYQRLIANPNPPYIIEEIVLKLIYWAAATTLEVKKGNTQNFAVEMEMPGSFIGYLNENAKVDVIYWTGSTDPKNIHVQASELGRGKCSLAQCVENMATGEKSVLKHLYGDLFKRYASRLSTIFKEIHLLKILRATYGSIPGLPSPPMLSIPPQTSFSEKSPPLLGAIIEQDYGAPLCKVTRKTLNTAQTVSLFCSFVTIMEAVQFLNNLEFPFSHVYHADLKPDNILANIEGDQVTLTLIDFGLYRELNDFLGSTWNLYADGYRCVFDDYPLNEACMKKDAEGIKAVMAARETYALGRILATLLNLSRDTPPSLREALLKSQAVFQNLPADFYWNIYLLTKEMQNPEYQKRIPLSEAINSLRQICDSAVNFLQK